jgi:hypothetical protein
MTIRRKIAERQVYCKDQLVSTRSLPGSAQAANGDQAAVRTPHSAEMSMQLMAYG